MGETVKKVISFSLYGDLSKYTIGAIKNSKLCKKFFPGWEMWVYHNDSVPQEILDTLVENDVKLINTQVEEGTRNALWRFSPAGDEIEESMREYFKTSNKSNLREVDQWFLKECIYPSVKDYAFINDDYINFEGTSVSISRDRILDDFAFIGEPFDENDNREHNYRDLVKEYYYRKK